MPREPWAAILLGACLTIAFVGCNSEDDPIEDTADEVEEAGESFADEMSDAANEIQEGANEAANEVNEAYDRATENNE